MKNFRTFLLSIHLLGACCLIAIPTKGTAQTKAFEQNNAPKVAVVNFKTCVEKSKIGQKEQANFDALKKQMESVLQEKEKSLTAIATKFNDIDYLDSLSPEAETELKRQFRTLNQEFTQQQNQFYQTLSQTNVTVIQKLTEQVAKAAEELSKKLKIDLVINSDGAFYYSPALDISQIVIDHLDQSFETESKDTKSNP